MNASELFIAAVQTAEDLPAALREHAGAVVGLEEHSFDASYIAFLDSQISLNARGPEWTARLVHRRVALLPFCDVTLLRGRVSAAQRSFTVEIDPETRSVIHWEEYDD